MSLIATRLQNWRVQNPELDRNMTRPCEYGALDFFIEQTDAPNSIISQNLRDRAFASIGNTVQVPVINYDGDVTVSNSRSCVISDAENTSALYTVVWKTYSVGFTMVPTLYMNNEISYDHDFARKMEKICRALATALDVATSKFSLYFLFCPNSSALACTISTFFSSNSFTAFSNLDMVRPVTTMILSFGMHFAAAKPIPLPPPVMTHTVFIISQFLLYFALLILFNFAFFFQPGNFISDCISIWACCITQFFSCFA